MATIHPSRLGLVPQNLRDSYPRDRDDRRARSPSPRRNGRRSPSRTPSQDRGNTRNSRGGRDERDERDGNRQRARARADDYFDGERGDDRESRRGRGRSRSLDRERDRERDERRAGDRPRRPSPEYSEYRRPTPPHIQDGAAAAPWRQQENMYPSRRDRMPLSGSDSGFLEGYVNYIHINFTHSHSSFSRRQQREQNSFSIWPPSPKVPARS
jgi:hypothetical protein